MLLLLGRRRDMKMLEYIICFFVHQEAPATRIAKQFSTEYDIVWQLQMHHGEFTSGSFNLLEMTVKSPSKLTLSFLKWNEHTGNSRLKYNIPTVVVWQRSSFLTYGLGFCPTAQNVGHVFYYGPRLTETLSDLADRNWKNPDVCMGVVCVRVCVVETLVST